MHLNVRGSPDKPRIRLAFGRRLLERMPLLRDLRRNKAPWAPVRLPCSPWAMVSVMVLLTENVTVKEWFEDPSEAMDETLAAHTLQVR